MKWFRLYDEIPEDPKMIQLSDQEFRVWIYLLCALNKQSLRGYCSVINPVLKIIRGAMNTRLRSVLNAIDKLESLGMVKRNSESLQIINWDKRQYKSDDVAERVKRYRNVTRNVTVTAPDTDTDTDTDKDKNIYILPMLGEFENVKLTEIQLVKLKGQFGEEGASKRIEALSMYCASKGKKYKDHYATILTWARKEEKEGKDDWQARFLKSDK